MVSRPGVDGDRRIEVVRQDPALREASGRVAWAGVRLHQLGPVYNRGPEKLRRRGPATWRRRRRRRCAGSEPAVPKRSNTVLWRCSKGRGRRAWRGSVHLAGAAAFTRQDNPGGLRRRGGKQRAIFSSAVEPLVTSRETTSATVDATVTELYFLIAARNAIFADRQLNCSTISESSEAPHKKLTTDFSKQHGKNSY